MTGYSQNSFFEAINVCIKLGVHKRNTIRMAGGPIVTEWEGGF